jgi:hypothetical protein
LLRTRLCRAFCAGELERRTADATLLAVGRTTSLSCVFAAKYSEPGFTFLP